MDGVGRKQELEEGVRDLQGVVEGSSVGVGTRGGKVGRREGVRRVRGVVIYGFSQFTPSSLSLSIPSQPLSHTTLNCFPSSSWRHP